MDFRVYHYGARGVFDGTKPVYGPASGLGWPMHYRYPPLFLLLFAPLASLPLGAAAAVWVVGKTATLAWLIAAMRKHGLPAVPDYRACAVAFFIIAPYLIEDFRYGNVQFFIVALTMSALLVVRDRPVLAATSLALAASIKVWPAIFLPYLAVRGQRRCVIYALGFVAVLAVLPAVYFGPAENFNLLGEWFSQEFRTQLSESEIWFPSQSLRGVLMRYLTRIDYSRVPDSNYASVNVAQLDPATIRLVWMIVAVAAYGGFLILSHRRRWSDGWLDAALAFCLVALLEPFTQKYALVVLLWPALALLRLPNKPVPRLLTYAAAILVMIQPFVPGANAQRLLQVLGFDFAAVVMLSGSFAVACGLESDLSQH